MQKSITSKALSLFLALVLALGVAPMVAFAADNANNVTAALDFVASGGTTSINAASSGTTVIVGANLSGTATQAGKLTVELEDVATSGITGGNLTWQVDVTRGQTIFQPIEFGSFVTAGDEANLSALFNLDVSFIASKWQVDFEANGGTTPASVINVEDGDTITVPNSTRDGFTLEGWYPNQNLTGDKLTASTEIVGAVTYYAKWTPVVDNTWVVTFHYNNALGDVPVNVTKGTPVAKPADPTKAGYGFVGWFTEQGVKWDFSTPISGNMHLNAHWIENSDELDGPWNVTFKYDNGSANRVESVEDGNKVNQPANPTKSGYTFAGWYTQDGKRWNFATKITGNLTLTAHWNRISTDSSNDNNTSGGGGGGGSTTTTTTVPNRSSNVGSDGSVNSTTVTNELKQALNTATTGPATLSIKNAAKISASTIKSLAKAAAAAGKQAVIHADTLAPNGSIQGRLYIDPAQLAGMTGDLNLGVETQGTRTETRKNYFEKHFSNKVAVVSFAQQGKFGAKLKIAAKITPPGNGKELVFYSYDAKTNSFKKFETAYRIDKNGFIHFETELAGDIIISDKPLEKK